MQYVRQPLIVTALSLRSGSGDKLRADAAVAQRPLDPAHTLDVVAHVADSLAVAQPPGLVHRDV